MPPRYRGDRCGAFTFTRGATTLWRVVISPRRSSYGLAGIGLFLGVVGGWVAGLLRAPRDRADR